MYEGAFWGTHRSSGALSGSDVPGFLAVYPHAGAVARASMCDPPGAPEGTPPVETGWVGAVSQPLYFSGDCSGGAVGVRNVTGVRSTNLHGAFGSSCVRLETDPPTSLLLNFSCGANNGEENDGEDLANSVVEQLRCASADCSGVCAVQFATALSEKSALVDQLFEQDAPGQLFASGSSVQVFKAHRLVYHSTLGLRVIQKKKKKFRPLTLPPELETSSHPLLLPPAP